MDHPNLRDTFHEGGWNFLKSPPPPPPPNPLPQRAFALPTPGEFRIPCVTFRVNPPLRTEPLPKPPDGVMGNPDPDPNRVGPAQPPVNFVDGNGYIVLWGVVEAMVARWGGGR